MKQPSNKFARAPAAAIAQSIKTKITIAKKQSHDPPLKFTRKTQKIFLANQFPTISNTYAIAPLDRRTTGCTEPYTRRTTCVHPCAHLWTPTGPPVDTLYPTRGHSHQSPHTQQRQKIQRRSRLTSNRRNHHLTKNSPHAADNAPGTLKPDKPKKHLPLLIGKVSRFCQAGLYRNFERFSNGLFQQVFSRRLFFCGPLISSCA